MGKSEHISALAAGTATWELFCESQGDTEAYYAMSYGYLNCRGANLRGVDLRGAHLKRLDLTDADLTGARLDGASIHKVLLYRARLIESHLARARVKTSYFDGADLTSATLFEASIDDCRFLDANLTFARLDAAVLTSSDMLGANLHNASLASTILQNITLNRQSSLAPKLQDRYPDHFRAPMHSANLTRAELSNTTFIDVDLSGIGGLAECTHRGRSHVDLDTLRRSRELPLEFLKGIGLSDWEIDTVALLDPNLTANHIVTLQQRAFELRTGPAIQYYSAFISYSSTDSQFARELHDALQARGIRCWLDEKKILPGEDLLEAIDKGIALSDKLILCCSRGSLERSWWIDAEIDKIIDKERTAQNREGRRVTNLIPVDLDGFVFDGWNGSRRSLVTSRKIANFRQWKQGDLPKDSLLQLVRALQRS